MTEIAQPPQIILPPYDHDAPCPKCRFAAGTTEFHPGYHGYESNPCGIPGSDSIASADRSMATWGGYYPDATRFLGGRENPKYIEEAANADRIMDLHRARKDAIPEHFDRVCPNCKHVWSERPA